ncbi:MAG: aryl-alcohol dehydrogenase-like predicted oxidoreductase [Luteibaculaceae bacterium]|jgi:aryl-alcohol dehydrogenase-like predicted oxidoreductase
MEYTLMGSSGIRISKICLGTMTFGTDWPFGSDKKESREVYHRYLEKGGNFLDTANLYTETTSEKYLGEFIQESGNRDELVISSKYSLRTDIGKINNSGNHRKNLVQTVEGSLKRLKIDYLDLLFLHSWDFTVDVEDVMRSLDILVQQGKVLHIGFSDTPAWVISRAQTIAKLRGWEPICALQMEYSLAERSCDREILPMSDYYNMSFHAWSPLANGILTGKYTKENLPAKVRMTENSKRYNQRNLALGELVWDIAKKNNTNGAAVALHWLFTRTPYMVPVIGARNAHQIDEQLESLSLNLPPEDILALDQASNIELGFPFDFLDQEHMKQNLYGSRYKQYDWLKK